VRDELTKSRLVAYKQEKWEEYEKLIREGYAKFV
jgi:hypothetical protein